MQRLTGAARPAIAIMADSPNVLMLSVDEEDVCATANPLRAPFEPPSIGGESRKIHVLTDNYQKSISFGYCRSVQIDPRRLMLWTPGS